MAAAVPQDLTAAVPQDPVAAGVLLVRVRGPGGGAAASRTAPERRAVYGRTGEPLRRGEQEAGVRAPRVPTLPAPRDSTFFPTDREPSWV